VGLGVWVAVAVRLAVGLAVALAVTVDVGEGVDVNVGDGELVASMVGVAVGVIRPFSVTMSFGKFPVFGQAVRYRTT
jgi:hypothetical protein